jgi:HAD superfamily phosphoserine phosphatase-like hydrolase
MTQQNNSKVTVVIPALNEEKTIGKVVKIAKSSANVDEVIVVDDRSMDNTVALAKQSGASVIISTKLGKGTSMRNGLFVAKNDIVAYLDADVENYEPDIVNKMTEPLIQEKADFVKTSFDREAGRITELVAKPLLSLLFPEALTYFQPLSGMIAGRRKFLEQVSFENDYGVDIGILLDMLNHRARIVEINIGKIDHKMKPWQELSKMSREVSRAILKRAKGRPELSLDSLETFRIIEDEMETAVQEAITGLKKMALFDMDNTLLLGRFIHKAAEEFNFKKQLMEILSTNQESFIITKMIARNLQGLKRESLLEVIDRIPLVEDATTVVKVLKNRGYIVGIVTDSYDFVAQQIQKKIGADFSVANHLDFKNGTASGEIQIPSSFVRTEKSMCSHNFCKSNALIQVAEKYGIDLSNIIAVGDSEYDICMVKFAGIGVAFCSDNFILNSVADYRIESKSFKGILEFSG